MNDTALVLAFLALFAVVAYWDRSERRRIAQAEADAIAAMSDDDVAHDRLNRAW